METELISSKQESRETLSHLGLHRGQHMRIRVESLPDASMAETFCDNLRVCIERKESRRHGMTKIVHADRRQIGALQDWAEVTSLHVLRIKR